MTEHECDWSIATGPGWVRCAGCGAETRVPSFDPSDDTRQAHNATMFAPRRLPWERQHFGGVLIPRGATITGITVVLDRP